MLIPQAIVQQGGGAGAWTVIHDETLGSDGTFDVSGISGSYADLQIRLLVRSDRAANNFDGISMRFNNDSGNNYSGQGFQSTATSLFAAELATTSIGSGTSLPYVALIPAATSPAGAVGWSLMDLPGYAGTTFWKQVKMQWGGNLENSSGNRRDGSTSAWWHSTSAITRVTIIPGSGTNFVTGSRLTILGLSVA